MLRAVYVRPLLQYATSVWSPYFNYAIDKTESAQRKFTKRLKGCKYMDYPARLSFLNLPSLERRRLIADLILTYSHFWITRYQDGRLFSTTVYQR